MRSNLAWDSNRTACASSSTWGWASRGMAKTRLEIRTASGSCAAIRSARVSAAASSSEGSWISVISRASRASCAG